MQPYPIATHTLDNGLRVAVAEAPSPGVAVNLWVEVGSSDEAPDRTGFAHLFEHLMFQGSAHVASGEHMALVESLGGTVNATTSADRTSYFETVPRGALELALWLEADRLASLDISAAHFEAQREVVKEEKRERYDNQPYGDLLELVIAQHFPTSHPYGHLTIGSMAHLDEAALGDVTRFFDTWYRASNTRLVLAGPISPDEGFRLADQYLGHLPGLEPPPAREPLDLPLLGPTTTTVTRPVPYSITYLSWPTPPAAAREQAALDLALMVLADGHAARLHRRLVRDLVVAQECQATSLTHRRTASVALLMARPADGTDPARLTTAMRDELARFVDEGPTEQELARALAQYERAWLWQLATAEDRADACNDAWLLWDDPGRINTHLDDVLALTPDTVRAAAATWLHPERAHELRYLKEDA